MVEEITELVKAAIKATKAFGVRWEETHGGLKLRLGDNSICIGGANDRVWLRLRDKQKQDLWRDDGVEGKLKTLTIELRQAAEANIKKQTTNLVAEMIADLKKMADVGDSKKLG